MKKWLAIGFTGVLMLALFYIATLMPPMGDPDNPTMLNVVPHYLERGVEEAGAENIITGIILNYRGYDTMGEVTVIFSVLNFAERNELIDRNLKHLGKLRGKAAKAYRGIR